MRQEKKIAYYRKQIEGLQTIVNKLRGENEILRKENQILKNASSSNREKLDSRLEEFESIRQKYSSCLDELTAAKNSYEAATASVYELKKKYKLEMDNFLKGIRKHSWF